MAPKSPDWNQLYRVASTTKDRARAVELFDEIAKSTSPFAEVSAYQAARLVSCGKAIPRYRRLYAGTFAREARLSVIECHLVRHDLSAAKTEIDRFLAKFEGRSQELRFLRAELARKQGNCPAAIPDYRASTGDHATYYLAWCQLEIGNESDGLATLRHYLDRYPAGRHASEARRALKKE